MWFGWGDGLCVSSFLSQIIRCSGLVNGYFKLNYTGNHFSYII